MMRRDLQRRCQRSRRSGLRRAERGPSEGGRGTSKGVSNSGRKMGRDWGWGGKYDMQDTHSCNGIESEVVGRDYDCIDSWP